MKPYLTILFLLSATMLYSQDNVSAIGLRGGGLSGITFKYIDDDFTGFELIGGAKEGGFILTGLIQKYRPIATSRLDGLFVFTGAGAHSGFAEQTVKETRVVEGITYYSYYERINPVFGGDFSFGVEYHFESVPVHLSLDYKPYFELFGEKAFRVDLWDIGFSVRYAINQ